MSATQNIYNSIWKYNLGNETGALYALDILCYPDAAARLDASGHQFASMYTWASIGDSNYNGGQLVLRHAMRHGMQMELSYTYSKSLDMAPTTSAPCTRPAPAARWAAVLAQS